MLCCHPEMDGSFPMGESNLVRENAGQEGGAPAQTPGGSQVPLAVRPSLPIRHSFVVRIWQEEGRATWRGWVEHTRTGEAAFVQELAELVSFIEARTGRLDG